MKIKSILVISAIVAIILVVVILPKPSVIPPAMTDNVEIKDESKVELGLNVSETPDFSESASLENQNATGFYIDEKGIKHYVLEVEDSPTIGK